MQEHFAGHQNGTDDGRGERPDGDPQVTAWSSGGRVLHVVTRYQRGGSERRIKDLVAALPELRHDLLVGADSDVDLARAQVGAASVSVLEPLVRNVSPKDDVRCLLTLRALLRARRPLAVVTHQSKAGALGRLAAASAGVPAVHSLSMASFGPGYGRAESLVFRTLERRLGRRTAGFAVVGADLASRFAAVGVPADRLHVVRSFVPLPAADALEPRAAVRRRLAHRHGVAVDGPLVAYVGSLDARKNVLAIPGVLAAAAARAGVAPAFVAAGAGPLHDELALGLAAHGLGERAVLTGHLADPADVADVLRGADVVLLLSKAEGLPQVLVQAAANGTPFVAHDVEGVAELLSLGAHGAATPLGDLDGVAEALAKLLVAPSAGDRPVADLSSWTQEAVHAGHRRVVLGALGRPYTPRPPDAGPVDVVDVTPARVTTGFPGATEPVPAGDGRQPA